MQTRENFTDTIGEQADSCLIDMRRTIAKLKLHDDVDALPLWKQRRARDECDVLSVLDLKQGKMDLKTRRRRETNDRFVADIYLGRVNKDLFFMRDLLKDARFVLDQCSGSKVALKETATECYDVVKKRQDMLHARFPLYSYKRNAFSSVDKQKQASETTNFYKMFQARRNAFNFLDKARQFREDRNYSALTKLTEDSLATFFQPASYRILPRKFEFVVEMCNNVALAYCEEMEIPIDLMKMPEDQRMFKLFAVPPLADHFQDPTYEFGDITTYRDPDKVDVSFIKYK